LLKILFIAEAQWSIGAGMKKYFLLISLTLIITSCSKKEEKFELFSPEAFAYSLDNGWELNATCRAKGFIQKERDQNFSAKLSYEVDLITPAGAELKNFQDGLLDKVEKEKFSEVEINTQAQLDSTYKTGKYIIVFNVTDNYSGKTIAVKKEFELSK
jgi:hypothetical protein